MKNWLAIKHVDWVIILCSLFLLTIGLLLQMSISYKTVGLKLDINLITQAFSIAGGCLAAAVLLLFKPITWKKYSWLIISIIVALLLAVLILGQESGGSRRWLDIGSLRFQPTEIAKVGVVFVLASILDTHSLRANRLSTLILSILPTVLVATLVAFQPDLGSAIVVVVIWLIVLLSSRINLSRYSLILIFIVAATIILIPFMAEYQQDRLVSYFNPTKDVSGANYNVVQASIAIGSGGLTGNGLESGSQSQLNFLPSQHTDFIFAVLGEKLGLIGAGLAIVAFAVLLTRMLFRAWNSKYQYTRLLLVGFASILAFHAVVNIGMNMGLLPVTGLPLPFLSYGGSFLFIATFMIVVSAALPLENPAA